MGGVGWGRVDFKAFFGAGRAGFDGVWGVLLRRGGDGRCGCDGGAGRGVAFLVARGEGGREV